MAYLSANQSSILTDLPVTADYIEHAYSSAAEAALFHAREAIQRSAQKPVNALDHYSGPIADAEWYALSRLLTSRTATGDISLANPQTRYRVQHALIHALLTHFDTIFADPACRTFLVTFAWDAGMTYRDSPSLDLTSMQRNVRRTLKGLGLHGIGAFEFDILRRKLPGETSRRLSAHAHIICWTYDPKFKPITAARALRTSGRFPNMLGVPAVDIVSRARSEVRRGLRHRYDADRDQTPGSIAHLGYYVTKAKFAALNRMEAKGSRTRARLLPDEGHFGRIDALRTADIYSRRTPNNAVFSFGEGADIRCDYDRNLARTSPRRTLRNSALDQEEISRAFAKIWRGRNLGTTEIL